MTYQLYFHIWNPKNYFPILAIISFLLLTLKPRDFIHQFPSLAHNPPFLRWIGPRAVICYRYNTGVDPLMWWEVGTQQRLLCLKQHRITSRGGPTWSLGCPMVPPTFIFIPIYIYILASQIVTVQRLAQVAEISVFHLGDAYLSPSWAIFPIQTFSSSFPLSTLLCFYKIYMFCQHFFFL